MNNVIGWWQRADLAARVSIVIAVLLMVAGATVLLVRLASTPAGTEPSRVEEPTPSTAPTVTPAPAPQVSIEPEEGHDEHDHPVEGIMATIDMDAAVQAEQDALAVAQAVATQPDGETAQDRAVRLAPLFTEGSPTPTASAPVPMGDAERMVVTPTLVQWATPFDPGGGRYGVLVSLQVRAEALQADGTVIQDVSTQEWRVVLVQVGEAWVPSVVYPADEADPTA